MNDEEENTPFEKALDSLTEKKRATRVEALKHIFEYLQNFDPVTIAQLEENQFSMREGINNALRGSEEERVWGCQVLSIYSITLGTEASELIPLYFPSLSKISHSSPPNLLIHSLTAQTFLLFVGGGESDTETFLGHLTNLMEKTSEAALSTIIHCWSFLLTTIPNSKIHDSVLPSALNIIFSVLRSSSNTDVRISAGEAIALLINCHRDYLLSKEEEFDIYELEGYISVDELLEVMEELKTEKERKLNVKNQKMLKKTFKTIYKGVVEFTSPSEQIKISETIITFDDWVKITQIRFFRSFLNSGLYVHLRSNDLFAQIFSFDVDFDIKVYKSVPDKARDLYRKQLSKERSKERRKGLQTTLVNQIQNNSHDD